MGSSVKRSTSYRTVLPTLLEFRTSFSHHDAPVALPVIASVAVQINPSIRLRTEHLTTCELLRIVFTNRKEVELFIQTVKNCGVQLSNWTTMELLGSPENLH